MQLSPDATTLVIFRPSPLARMEIERFYDHLQYKNRVLFLTGDSGTYERVLERSAYLRAIGLIIAELAQTGVRETDPQLLDAKTLQTREQAAFYLACREAFRQLLYPSRNGLTDLALEPRYAGNNFDGERAIVDALRDAFKYEPEANANNPAFVDRIVTKLWSGAKEIPWNEVKARAASGPSWIWHHPRALDDVRAELLRRDQWRDIGNGFVQRGPFPPPRPAVQVQLLARDERTGEATLRVRPLHGDTVYQEAAGATSVARQRLEGYDVKTTDLRLAFTAANAAEGVEGDLVVWTNTLEVKYGFYGPPGARMCELRSVPDGAAILYTTDGSNPAGGRTYSGPFAVPPGCALVLAQASAEGVLSPVLRAETPAESGGGDGETWHITPDRPATWRKGWSLDATGEVFTFLEHAARRAATMGGLRLVAGRDGRWAELQLDDTTFLCGEAVREMATRLRDLIGGASLTMEVGALAFDEGQQLLDLSADLKESPERRDVAQH